MTAKSTIDDNYYSGVEPKVPIGFKLVPNAVTGVDLEVSLPSGRALYYHNPVVVDGAIYYTDYAHAGKTKEQTYSDKCKRRKNNRNNQPHCKTKLSTALRAPKADKASVLRIWAQFSKFASNRARIWSRLAFLGLLSRRRLAAKARSALAGRSSFFTL